MCAINLSICPQQQGFDLLANINHTLQEDTALEGAGLLSHSCALDFVFEP